MATNKITRTDDTAATLQNIATISFTEDAETRHAQQCALVDATTPTQKLAIDASGHLQADIAAASVAVPVTDNAGSLTVDNSTLSVVGGGTEATALRVTVASDSTGVLSVDDNGASLTVDGTVTANAGTGDFLSVTGHTRNEAFKEANAVGGELDDTAPTAATEGNVSPVRITAQRAFHSNLRKDDGTEIASGGGVEANALRVTVASDSTGVLSVDDNAGTLTVDAPVGTPVNVQIGDATNTATIRNLAANDALNVAIVDGAGDQITTFGGGTQYTEADIDASITGTAVMWEDASDTLRAVSSAKPLPVNVVAGGGTGGTAIADESAFTEGTTNFTPVGGVLNDTITSDPAEDQGAAFRITAKRGLHVNLRNVGGTEVGTATDPVRVDPTGTTAQPVTDNAGSLTVDNAALSVTGGGVEATALRVTIASDSTGVLSIDDNAGSLTVDGTVAVSSITTDITPGTGATNLGKAEDGAHTTGDVGVMALVVANEGNTARAADNDYLPPASDTEGNLRVVGNRDHDAADAGEVVKVGGVAVSGSATPTSVAASDRTRWIFNQHGIPYVLGGHPNLIVREFDFGTAAQTDLNLAAAVVAADERIYVTRFEAMADNANSVAVAVRAGFGTASVPTASATGVSGMIGSHPGLAAGSGFICGNGAGVIAVGGAGEEPRLTSSAATGGNLHVIFAYFLVDETP